MVSPVQGRGRGGWVLRAADMPSIPSVLLCFGQMCRAGRGLQEDTGHPPCPQFKGTTRLGQLEWPGILLGENQPKLSVANLSLAGLSLGQRPPTLQVGPPRSPGAHMSLESREVGRGRGGRPEILE